jgi:hypothetical protein
MLFYPFATMDSRLVIEFFLSWRLLILVRFLLHADFVLIASREDIDSSSLWNKSLLQHLPGAIHSAIEEFNRGNFRYSWLPYLPVQNHVSDAFKRVREHTLQLLRESRILESIAGELTAPSNLLVVPKIFLDETGNPLLLTPETQSKYLSRKYPLEDCEHLRDLGVPDLSTDGFIDDLQNYVLNYPREFQNQSLKWHSCLAQVLLGLVARYQSILSIVSSLEIAPLRDGSWATPQVQTVFFSAESNDLIVPKGINILEIHPTAQGDKTRRHLLSLLGVQDFQAASICNTIVCIHEDAKFDPIKFSPGDLISHAMFLYKAKWDNSGTHDIWFKTDADTCYLGSQIYMDSNQPYSAKSIFTKSGLSAPFLHKDYYSAFAQGAEPSELNRDANWQVWLQKHLHVAPIPRLVYPPFEAPFSIAREFETLITSYDSSEVLLLLKFHWEQYYSRWILSFEGEKSKPSWKCSREALISKISGMNAKCQLNTAHTLNKTYLPRTGTPKDSNNIFQFLDVPEPDDPKWSFLGHLGVVVNLDTEFYLERLRRLQDSETSVAQVSELYAELDRLADSKTTVKIRLVRSYKLTWYGWLSDAGSDTPLTQIISYTCRVLMSVKPATGSS